VNKDRFSDFTRIVCMLVVVTLSVSLFVDATVDVECLCDVLAVISYLCCINLLSISLLRAGI